MRLTGVKTGRERGDTLVEVVIALAILAFVLLGATLVATSAFRTGQTARERTQVSNEAQRQMEALRSFRDNHTWDEFRVGVGASYPGVDNVPVTPCRFDATKHCFHMETQAVGANTEFVPVTGSTVGSVPTSTIEIWADNSAAAITARPCNYDFELHYSFQTLGGGVPAQNHIRTRLANLKYVLPAVGPGTCL
ncbi:MAG TPA: prepilin-type N-terminal cleavage/methylation domain-containing protein [Candidatus Saccharimonadia bacterium]|nr:prepilin-type N-terminal cleavage/methylation domain-containing protein [Candidatus Saccharimonadia bacterium]